jgi:oligopeptide transport system ATP-binding protein
VVPTPAVDDAPLLRLDGLNKTFVARRGLERVRPGGGARTAALSDVNLTVRRGDTIGIVGESGSGKTTLARSIVRLVEPDAGSIEFDGRDLLALKGSELAQARRRIQMVYQDPYSSLNPALSVGSAIAEPIRVHCLRGKGEIDARVIELMGQVGLDSAFASRRPRELSGGQRQRVAIARALAAEPEILIADEAVSALDVSIQAQVITLFEELQQSLGLTMLFVSHQLAAVAQVCARVAVMYRGSIVEEGPTTEVFERPRHGYTLALLRAHPGQQRFPAGGADARAGALPPPVEEPGCPFRHQCDFVAAECERVTPESVSVGECHTARCHVLPSLSAAEVHDRLSAVARAAQERDLARSEMAGAPGSAPR